MTLFIIYFYFAQHSAALWTVSYQSPSSMLIKIEVAVSQHSPFCFWKCYLQPLASLCRTLHLPLKAVPLKIVICSALKSLLERGSASPRPVSASLLQNLVHLGPLDPQCLLSNCLFLRQPTAQFIAPSSLHSVKLLHYGEAPS